MDMYGVSTLPSALVFVTERLRTLALGPRCRAVCWRQVRIVLLSGKFRGLGIQIHEVPLSSAMLVAYGQATLRSLSRADALPTPLIARRQEALAR